LESLWEAAADCWLMKDGSACCERLMRRGYGRRGRQPHYTDIGWRWRYW
jgi:hypothetical protein